MESVKIEEVLLVVDRKAEAARKSSSRSDTVKRDEPIDLVADADAEDKWIEDSMSQSSTVPTEQNPDSHDPRRRRRWRPPAPEDAPDDEDAEDVEEKEDSTESSWVIHVPPE